MGLFRYAAFGSFEMRQRVCADPVLSAGFAKALSRAEALEVELKARLGDSPNPDPTLAQALESVADRVANLRSCLLPVKPLQDLVFIEKARPPGFRRNPVNLER